MHEAVPSAINNKGDVVGADYLFTNQYPAGTPTAILYENGQMHDLGAPYRFASMALGINDRGVIVGGLTPIEGSGYQEAFLYDGSLNIIGTPGSLATGINNKGQVVGYAPKSDSLYFPYFAVLTVCGKSNRTSYEGNVLSI